MLIWVSALDAALGTGLGHKSGFFAKTAKTH
jgi:hypothetical protein